MDYKVFEGRVLELLFKTSDRVTAQLAAYKIGVSVDEARTMLEAMATTDVVSMESDDNGSLYFDLLSRPPPTGQPLSWSMPQAATAPPPLAAMPPPMAMMPPPMAMVPVMMPPLPVIYSQEKSMAAAIVLPFFFGPLGMLYSTVTGALVMFFAGGFFTVVTLGFGILLVWPGCVLWSALAANAHNNGARNQLRYLHAQQAHHMQYVQHMQHQQHTQHQPHQLPPRR